MTRGIAATFLVVKLVRTLMIIPICLGLAAVTERRRRLATSPCGVEPAIAGLTARNGQR